MKRSVITDEIASDIDVAAGLAVEHQLEGLEIRNVFGLSVHEQSPAQLAKIKQTAERNDLAIVALSTIVFKCDVHDVQAFEQHLAILATCFQAAKTLGTNLLRIFSFFQSTPWEETSPLIVEKLKVAADLALQEGMVLMLESDPGVYATNAKKLLQLIQAVDSPALKVLWDPGNDLYDPDLETPFPDGYRLIAPYIEHVHVKDAIRLPDGTSQCVPFGTGQVDWVGQWKALKEAGYQGYLSMETHYRVNHAISEDLMKLPKGHSFSDGAFEATNESLTLWDEMCKRMM